MTANPKYRVPVRVDIELYEKFKAYADATGKPLAELIREALGRFSAKPDTGDLLETEIAELEHKLTKLKSNSIKKQ